MAKLNLEMLRWIILGSNVLLLTLAGFVGYEFFMGDRKDRRQELPDPEEFVVREDSRRSGGDASGVWRVLGAKEPVRRQVDPPPRVPPKQEVRADGPLQDLSYINSAKIGGFVVAHVQKRGAQTNVTPPRSSRGRSSARGRSRRTGRSPARRPVRGKAPTNRETWGVFEGDRFRGCEIVRITYDKIFYVAEGSPGTFYELDRELEDPFEDAYTDDGTGIVPIEPPDDEALVSNIEEDERGSIISKHLSESPSKRSAAPNRSNKAGSNKPRTPTKRTPGRSMGGRR